MNLKWNLDELFASAEECLASFVEIDNACKRVERFRNEELTADSLKMMLDERFECQSMAYKAQVYGSLMYYTNISSEETKALKSAVEKKYSDIVERLAFVDEKIVNEGADRVSEMLFQNEEAAIYRVYIDGLFKKDRHVVASEEKAQLQKEINALLNEYNALVNGVKIEPLIIDGKKIELTLHDVGIYLVSRDCDTRKSAFENLNAAYESVLERAADILNDIYERRAEVSKIEGYASVLEASLDKEDVESLIIDKLIACVHKNLPFLQKYMALKADYMGIEGAHLYDLGVPIDFDVRRKYPIDEGVRIVKEAFSVLGDDYVSLAMKLMHEGHVDAQANDERHPTIVFSWLGYSFLSYKENYNDLKNLVHELGHSINDSLSLHLPFPYRISTVFTGETASITNEILLNRCLLEQASDDEERAFYLSKEIDNFVTSLYRQTMYTEFEKELYEQLERGSKLTMSSLNERYMRLVKTYYGDEVVYDEANATEWVRLGKLYRWAFYSYNYATGIVIANAVYSKLKDKSLAVKDYIGFLSSGAKEPSLELLRSIGVDLTRDELFERAFEVLEEDMKELETILAKKRLSLKDDK